MFHGNPGEYRVKFSQEEMARLKEILLFCYLVVPSLDLSKHAKYFLRGLDTVPLTLDSEYISFEEVNDDVN